MFSEIVIKRANHLGASILIDGVKVYTLQRAGSHWLLRPIGDDAGHDTETFDCRDQAVAYVLSTHWDHPRYITLSMSREVEAAHAEIDALADQLDAWEASRTSAPQQTEYDPTHGGRFPIDAWVLRVIASQYGLVARCYTMGFEDIGMDVLVVQFGHGDEYDEAGQDYVVREELRSVRDVRAACVRALRITARVEELMSQ